MTLSLGRHSLAVEFWHQWQPLFKRGWNWVDLWLIHLCVESGTYIGRYVEMEAALLGFGVTVELFVTRDRAEFSATMRELIDDGAAS